MQLPISTVKSKLYRGRDKLITKFKEGGVTHEKVNLYELFGHLDSKDVLLTDIKSDSVNCDEEKIRNMTLKKFTRI